MIVFLASASSLGICTLVSGLIALYRASGSTRGVKAEPAFGFFAAAGVLGTLNLILFGILLYFVDSTAREINEVLDKAAFYAWLPLQPVIWIASAMIFNRSRKKG